MGEPARDRGLQAWLSRHPRLGPEALAEARARADRACRGLGSPLEELRARGYTVAEGPLGVPGALVRARVDLARRRILVDPQGLEDLSTRLLRRGLGGEALQRILAHELFHVLDPACPEALAELAAHLFATDLLGLEDFAGCLDLPEPPDPVEGGPGACP